MPWTKLVAFEARTAELAPLRIDAIPVVRKDAHRTHRDADTAVVAPARVNIYFNKDGGRGTDLHILSHLSGMLPDERQGYLGECLRTSTGINFKIIKH
jgi:hypothetical protein